jgi:hypothetical protein
MVELTKRRNNENSIIENSLFYWTIQKMWNWREATALQQQYRLREANRRNGNLGQILHDRKWFFYQLDNFFWCVFSKIMFLFVDWGQKCKYGARTHTYIHSHKFVGRFCFLIEFRDRYIYIYLCLNTGHWDNDRKVTALFLLKNSLKTINMQVINE